MGTRSWYDLYCSAVVGSESTISSGNSSSKSVRASEIAISRGVSPAISQTFVSAPAAISILVIS